MNSLRKMKLLLRQTNAHPCVWNPKCFHTKSNAFGLFVEKPTFLKKIKVKQARMQKDDGMPTFLKNGLPDKILYNFTLGSTIICTFISFYIIYKLEHPDIIDDNDESNDNDASIE